MIPFTGLNKVGSASVNLYTDNNVLYPAYNPNTNVSCVYTECVAKTLAVPNANGCFRLGNYCIYIE